MSTSSTVELFSQERAALMEGPVARQHDSVVFHVGYPEAHDTLRFLIQKSLGERRPAFIFVNNRLDGNAPGTIRGVLGLYD